MPLSVLDPTPALVVVDLQPGILATPLVHPTEAVVANAARLADGFRAAGLPVVLVTVAGVTAGRTDAAGPAHAEDRELGDVVEELRPDPADMRVVKRRWGAFHATDLHDQLAARGITQVILAGVATSIGVESTARAASEHGYHVVLATDAMTDRDADAHHNSVTRIFPRLGETAATADVLAALDAR